MSYEQQPDSGDDQGPGGVVKLLHRLGERVRTHAVTWPEYYVDMRLDARTD
ncbi:hypothetical protein [Haloglomus irregulare]|jgi:hypothetical protein|uniref:hypothetical protein n=1 Tax=Haloglomus irregulare TaxID=2234134 RepID=UPI00163D9C79|nr:hypothetical protein [Haloglomus irregulare]